ncbi:hypothetical protein Y032_0004g2253 [Ancylostoma ceylanicum]|uniref:Uncharacterized protein n=1 Tax=Ancylostoma ceylanicum TaxID=53326 RepID=A0A016VX93_9BILA|nr:hypothetical protein Y032_0004g2253 [Ancylostoma ceylanicum]
MVILVLEPTVMIGYSAVNKNRKEVNHICIKEKLMHQKQAQPSKSKESFGFLKTATWRRDEGRFMSPLSILCVLLLVYTASTEVVNEIRGTNEDENTVDITEEKPKPVNFKETCLKSLNMLDIITIQLTRKGYLVSVAIHRKVYIS